MTHKFTTTHVWYDAEDNEHEAEVSIEYNYYAGYKGSMEEPPEDPSVEVQSVRVTFGDMPDHVLERFSESEELRDECFVDLDCRASDAAEYKAEMRAERDW